MNTSSKLTTTAIAALVLFTCKASDRAYHEYTRELQKAANIFLEPDYTQSQYQKAIVACLPTIPMALGKIIINYLTKRQFKLKEPLKEREIPDSNFSLKQFCKLSPNNKYLAISIQTGKGYNQGVAIYNPETLDHIATLQEKSSGQTEAYFSDDGSLLAIRTPTPAQEPDSNTDSISIWKTNTWELININTFKYNCSPLFWPKTHDLVLLHDNGVNTVNVYNNTIVQRFETDEKEDVASTAAVSSNGQLVAFSINAKVIMMNANTKARQTILPPNKHNGLEIGLETISLKFSPTNKFLIWELEPLQDPTTYSILYNIKKNAIVLFVKGLSHIHMLAEDQEFLAITKGSTNQSNSIVKGKVKGKIKETSKDIYTIPTDIVFHNEHTMITAMTVSSCEDIVIALSKITITNSPGRMYVFNNHKKTKR